MLLGWAHYIYWYTTSLNVPSPPIHLCLFLDDAWSYFEYAICDLKEIKVTGNMNSSYFVDL